MKSQRIELIPIREIRIVNPRERNMVTFSNIVANIDKVGLKKPITVTQRELEADGTRYDLAYGEGRLKAVESLGDATVPAIIVDASPQKRYLMSLVENIARHRPSNSDLVREVRSLLQRGHKNKAIAVKLGLDVTYINNIIRLLRKGENKLVAQVEAGAIPIGIAVQIACSSTADIQKALSEAYENGDLRGTKFRAAQALIARRFGKKQDAQSQAKPVSSKDLVREYERHTQRQRNLVRRANVVSDRLALLRSALARVFEDDHFVTLLRTESLPGLPDFLSKPA